jgi:hypothetical protein
MKPALRGKTPTDLPGGGMVVASVSGALSGPGMSGAPGAPGASGIPSLLPPAPISGGRSREPVRPAEGTIDGWFLDRLFSRR